MARSGMFHLLGAMLRDHPPYTPGVRFHFPPPKPDRHLCGFQDFAILH
jgi:hypothetical protein